MPKKEDVLDDEEPKIVQDDVKDEEEVKTDEDPKDDGSPSDGQDIEKMTPAEMKALLKEKDQHISDLNKESAKRRQKLKAFEDAEEERRREAMSELELAQDDAKKARDAMAEIAKENQRLKVQASITGKAFEIDEKELFLIDPADFQLPDNKTLEDVPQLLEELYSKKPHYFREAKEKINPDDDPGTPGGRKKVAGRKRDKPIELPRMKL